MMTIKTSSAATETKPTSTNIFFIWQFIIQFITHSTVEIFMTEIKIVILKSESRICITKPTIFINDDNNTPIQAASQWTDMLI